MEKVKVDLKHEVECPGHDNRIVEGDHGGDAEEAIAKATKARDETREDLLRTKNIYFWKQQNQTSLNLRCGCAGVLTKDILHEEEWDAEKQEAKKIPEELTSKLILMRMR